jgi:site-specific DNA recombinase
VIQLPANAQSPIRAVAYIRVSQAREDMISPELQILAITDYCKRRGYNIVRTIEDLDLSGRFWDHRQVEQAITMLEHHQADILVVWRWSRVARNRLDWALAVNRVETVGGRLESATEGFDTSTATGRFARGMLAEFAAFESDRMGDIWREVRDRRARMGLNPTGLEQFGYRKIGGRFLPDRRTGPVIVKLYQRYIDGESFRSLARWLNRRHYTTARPRKPDAHWEHSTVSNIMDRGFAAGLIITDGTFLPGAHQALITPEEWQAYRARRDATRWHYRSHEDTALLDGMLHCVCGHAMKPEEASAAGKAKYRCRPHNTAAKATTVLQERVDRLVHEWLVDLATDPELGERARQHSYERSRQALLAARHLAKMICADSRRPVPDDTRMALVRAEAAAPWRDPVELAQSLCQDWGFLDTRHRRDRLTLLTDGVVVDNRYSFPVVTVSTAWGDERRYGARRLQPELAAPISNPPATPAFGGGMPTSMDWLTPLEAARIAGVHPRTIDLWRRAQLLPHTIKRNTFWYSLDDIRRVTQAPRRTSGVDRAALRRDLAQSPP